MIYLNNYVIDFLVQNNLEKQEKNNIPAKYKNNLLLFDYDNESIKININNDNIIMEKDNTESSLKFNFKLNKKCEGNYFIKQLNSYLDTEILTNQLIIDENRIYIEYELWIQEEYAGLFKYEIIIKEM